MVSRIATFLIAACALFYWAYSLFGLQYAPWGAVAGALVWLLWDMWNAHRFDRALRMAQAGQDLPALRGVWSQYANRVHRMLRSKDQEIALGMQRHTQFLAALQASPNGVLLLDSHNRIEWCNQTAAAHLGLDSQRDALQHIGNLVREPSFAAYLIQQDFTQEVIFASAVSTTSRPVKISAQLHMYGASSKLLLTRDVTVREQADAMRRDFVANVSHEIRTPLTVLSGFVETLQNLPLDEAQRGRYLTLMAQQSQRMQSLVNDLLTLSKLEGNPLPDLHSSVSVNSLFVLCEQDARALSQTLDATMHRLHFECEVDCEILGERNELLSAMGNLVHNAARYTPPGGKIDVRWHVLRDGRGEFMVTDTGPGIAPEHIPRLTERFYRIDRSRSRVSGGTGLGLAIVKHVVQRHGGELHIHSEVGKGARFAFTLPAQRVRLPG
jgi:two-component system, OmpR family, phosphate regulon sensor histidine kinase PhoR